MSKLPVVSSQVQILRMEVWVTNRNGSTTETRDVVGLMDLAEPDPISRRLSNRPRQPIPGKRCQQLCTARSSHDPEQPQKFFHYQQAVVVRFAPGTGF